MDDGYLPGRRDDAPLAARIAGLGAGIAGLWSLLFAHPTPPPPPGALRGCFTSPLAPSLLFDGATLRIGQAGMPAVPYRLQLAKYATIDIVTDRPRRLEAFGSRYVFDRDEPPLIVFARASHVVDGQTYGVLRIADATFLSVPTSQGDVRYDRAAPADCYRTPQA